MIALSVLSRLWLEEPNEATLAEVTARGEFPSAPPEELSRAYGDLFLLNVYPYGTVFTDPSGELNGPAALRAAARFFRAGYAPPALSSAGAPDHVGLCLGYLAHRESTGEEDSEFLSDCLDWIPLCALAVERDPSAHPFYRVLAVQTREALWAREVRAPAADSGPDEHPDEGPEATGLAPILKFLLTPARCGLFLSRSRLAVLAREAGLRLSFGGRFEVARALFLAAGGPPVVGVVLAALEREVGAWTAFCRDAAREHPIWRESANRWLRRLEETRERLLDMRRVAADPARVEYGLAPDAGFAGSRDNFVSRKR